MGTGSDGKEWESPKVGLELLDLELELEGAEVDAEDGVDDRRSGRKPNPPIFVTAKDRTSTKGNNAIIMIDGQRICLGGSNIYKSFVILFVLQYTIQLD